MQYIDDAMAFKKYIYEQCHCVNAGQTSEERRIKYAIARALGKDPNWSRVLRDYRRTALAKYFGYSSWKNLLDIIRSENV